jgi:hypothetical protein
VFEHRPGAVFVVAGVSLARFDKFDKSDRFDHTENMTTPILDRPPPGSAQTLLTSIALDDLTTSTKEAAMGKDELTPTEVAREFNVSPATVRRWEDANILKPSRRLPGKHGHRRYSRASVEALKQRLAAPESDGHEGSGD